MIASQGSAQYAQSTLAALSCFLKASFRKRARDIDMTPAKFESLGRAEVKSNSAKVRFSYWGKLCTTN